MTGEGRRGEPRPDPSRSAEPYWPAPAPINSTRPPDGIAARPQGDVPVIARVVWATHEELLPARAIRWTSAHVMLMVKAPGAPSNTQELLVWLRAEDVHRTIPKRPNPSRQVSG